jgi:hypothetical protein
MTPFEAFIDRMEWRVFGYAATEMDHPRRTLREALRMRVRFEPLFPWLDVDLRPQRYVETDAFFARFREKMRGLGEMFYKAHPTGYIGDEAHPLDDMVNASLRKLRPEKKSNSPEAKPANITTLFLTVGFLMVSGLAGYAAFTVMRGYYGHTVCAFVVVPTLVTTFVYWLSVVVCRGFYRDSI